jgi:hypothetical protein
MVQKYIERPLTVVGGRKFDIRAWVLLAADYRICLYREGVLRTAAVPYSLEDLSDRFAHLSNHCIAKEHPDYGQHEPTNEMWWADFDEWLRAEHGEEHGFFCEILPQIRTCVVHTLLAGRDFMENAETVPYQSFHLFGFDLMVDESFKVSLIEVNSSPAVAADLMPNMTEDLVHCAIDPVMPPSEELTGIQRSNLALAVRTARRAAKYLTVEQTLALAEATPPGGPSVSRSGTGTGAGSAAGVVPAASAETMTPELDVALNNAAADAAAAGTSGKAANGTPFLRGFEVLWDPARCTLDPATWLTHAGDSTV